MQLHSPDLILILFMLRQELLRIHSEFQKFKLVVNKDHNLFFENLIEIQIGLCSDRALVSLKMMIMQL